MRLFRSPLRACGAILVIVGLLVAVLSAVEWNWQRDEDSALREGGTAITGTVYAVKTVSRGGKPAVVRVNYTFQGEREAEVDVSNAPDRDALAKGSSVDLLVAANEPSSPRSVDAVRGGDAAYWRNSALGGVVVLIVGLALVSIAVLRDRRYGE